MHSKDSSALLIAILYTVVRDQTCFYENHLAICVNINVFNRVKDALKSFADFKNKQKSAWNNVFDM